MKMLIGGEWRDGVESLPLGGAKGSGNAREGIHDTLLDMTEARTLLIRHAFAGSAEAVA